MTMLTQARDDAYHQLWRQAAHHRGLREVTGELPGHTLSQNLRQWPRTCGADVVAIAAVIDPVLRAAPLETGGHGIERKWLHCASALADAALREPAREYRHNREFWSTLASIAAYLSGVDAPVPDHIWPALLSEVASPSHPAPDATIVDDTLRLNAYSYRELWQAQKRELATLRGSDVSGSDAAVHGGRMIVPRTSIADVVQLAAFWTDVLAEVERHRHVMGGASSHALHAGLDGELARWDAVLAGLETHATTGNPGGTYPENEAFWRGTGSVSITAALLDAPPPPFELTLDHRGRGHRNATYPGEGTFESRWDRQHDDFIEARGFDTRDPLPARTGRPMKVPRTLNAEIVKLARDWNAAWKKLEDRRGVFGNIPNEIGLDTLKKRWTEVMKDVHEIAEPGKVEEVYSKNHEFWRETFDLARTLDLFNEIPKKFDIAIDVSKTLPDRFANVVGQIAHAVGDIAHKAGGRRDIGPRQTDPHRRQCPPWRDPAVALDAPQAARRGGGVAMSRNVFPWLVTGGAVAVIIYIGTRPPDSEAPEASAAPDEPRERPFRNASLSYRSLGRVGERYPDWVRALRGKSGVYIIRERQRDRANPIVYVGESHTNRLYQTLTRHFQAWRRAKKFWTGQYGGQGHDPGLTYDRARCTVAVRVLPAERAMDEEARLIARLRPRDNLIGQPQAAETDEVVPF
jgi:hypothetical protein